MASELESVLNIQLVVFIIASVSLLSGEAVLTSLINSLFLITTFQNRLLFFPSLNKMLDILTYSWFATNPRRSKRQWCGSHVG